MKTYKQFKEAAILAAPLAVPVGKAIGAGLAATGLTGMIMQGRRTGENRRSQSVDYGQVFQASKEDKERRKQLAKDHNLDITKPGDRAKLGRLLKKDTEAKKRAAQGDTRSQEQYRQEKAENRKTIDATRQSMGQSKAKPGTKERAEIDKKLKDFRDELRDVTNDPIIPSTRARVRVKVGQEVPKPDNTLPPRTGASPQRVRDRRSYEAQQRRNRKVQEQLAQEQMVVPRSIKKKNPLMSVETEKEILMKLSNRPAVYHRARTGKPMYPFSEENKHRDRKLYGQYKQLQNPQDPKEQMVRDALRLKLKKA